MSGILIRCVAFVVLLSSCSLAIAQTAPVAPAYREKHDFDLALSASSSTFSGALSWSHLHGFGKKKQRFKVGYGIRLTSFVGANIFYTTAPAEYTSPVQGPTTIFSETFEENIDTITTATAQTNSLNASVHLQYSITSKWEAGFNIDVIGFSFGGRKKMNVLSSVYDHGQSPVVEAKPTAFNLLLTSDNDLGSLNSEFYLRYWFNSKMALRAGYTFLFSEYQTTQDLSFDQGRIVNDRYRYKAGMLMLGFTFRPFANNSIQN